MTPSTPSRSIEWILHSFAQLNKHELYEILRLRTEVFVVEQDCPYQDIDGFDDRSFHLMGWTADGQLAAYARILPPGVDPYSCHSEVDGPHAAIGRVVVSPACRGIGHQLMEQALKAYEECVGKDVPCIIHAQAHLKHYYERHGFVQSSGIYLIDNIPHIEMIRPARS